MCEVQSAAVCFSARLLVSALQVDELVADELLESLEVLAVELDVVVPGALHPQRLHGPLTALVQSQAVREVDHLVLRAVDHQHRRRHLRDLVDAAGRRDKNTTPYLIPVNFIYKNYY